MSIPLHCSKCGATLLGDTSCCHRCNLATGLDHPTHPLPDLEFLDEFPPDPGFVPPVSVSTPAAPEIGSWIGPYRLLEQIGEGGFGIVYMAEQLFPIRRKVALKILKPGMDTKTVVARFEAERQALALMEHPHIAKVLDAGTTSVGHPYFIMELVLGTKITDFCDQHQISTHDRLKLFVDVCSAIQHAHHKGILHRDIKPSNILVTSLDGVPVAKVIDFGIAKALRGQELTDKTLFTGFGQFLGTPTYMSPEQMDHDPHDIDARSDIYSLGVLLYELLVGCPPFDSETLRAAGMDAIRKTIRDVEPIRPSTKLSKLGALDLAAAAHKRATNAPKLASEVSGDLDWIVIKCLEKRRERRYEGVGDLAEDLLRHLECKPIAARPPSHAYLLQKTLRRNRKKLQITAGILSIVVVALFFATSQLKRAQIADFKFMALQRSSALNAVRLQSSEASPNNRPDQIPLLAGLLRRFPQSHEIGVKLMSELADQHHALPYGYPRPLPASPNALRISPRAGWIALGSSNQVLLADFPRLQNGFHPVAFNGVPTTFTFSPDDQWLLVAATKTRSRLYSTRDTSQWIELEPGARNLSFDATSKFLFGQIADDTETKNEAPTSGLPAMWSVETGKRVQEFRPRIPPQVLSLSRDGMALAGIGTDGEIMLWHRMRPDPVWVHVATNKNSWVEFVMDGNQLLVVEDLHDPDTNREFQRFELLDALSGDSNTGPLYTSSPLHPNLQALDPSIRILKSDAGTYCSITSESGQSTFPVAAPVTYAIGTSGEWFAMVDQMNQLWIYDNRPSVQGRPTVPANSAHRASVSKLLKSGDGSRALAMTSKSLSVYEFSSRRLVSQLKLDGIHPIVDLLYGGEGSHALARFGDGTARAIAFTNQLGTISPPLLGLGHVIAARLARNGLSALLIDESTGANVVDISSQKQIGTTLSPKAIPSTVIPEIADIHPDGSILFLPEFSNSSLLIPVGNAPFQRTQLIHESFPVWASFSDDGKKLFCVTADRRFHQWDVASREKLPFVMDLPENVRSFKPSPSGQRVLLGVDREGVGKSALEVHDLDVPNATAKSKISTIPVSFMPSSADWFDETILMSTEPFQLFSTLHEAPLLREPNRDWSIGMASPDSKWVLHLEQNRDQDLVYFTEMFWPTNQAPEWVPELSEALAGERIGRDGKRVPIPSSEYIAARDRMLSMAANDSWRQWFQWLVADRATRPSSPSAKTTEDSTQTLPKLVISLQTIKQGPAMLSPLIFPKPKPHTGLADSINRTERAATLLPDSPHLWETRAAIWNHLGNRRQEEAMVDRGLRSASNHVDLLLRKLELNAKPWNESVSANIIARLQGLIPSLPAEERSDCELRLQGLLRAAHRHDIAILFNPNTRSIPTRASDLPETCIDLTSIYNATLNDNLIDGDGPGEFQQIKTSPLWLNSTQFDLRGILVLKQEPQSRRRFPAQYQGIPIQQTARKIHFLVAGFELGLQPTNLPLGSLTLHFRDLPPTIVPLRSGIELDDAFAADGPCIPAWPSVSRDMPRNDSMPRIYELLWTNPRPETPLLAIDFAMTTDPLQGPMPFRTLMLFAITVEP